MLACLLYLIEGNRRGKKRKKKKKREREREERSVDATEPMPVLLRQRQSIIRVGFLIDLLNAQSKGTHVGIDEAFTGRRRLAWGY